jgi:undecaprenyl-diphosphatase
MNFPALIRRASRELHVLIPAAILCGSVLIFGEVIDEVKEGELSHLDEQALLMLRSSDDPGRPIGPAWLRTACLDLTALGGGAVLTLLTLLVLGYLLLNRRLHAAILLAVAALGGLALNNGLKHFFARERPGIVPHLSEVSSASFPSGHSMLSAIIYLTLGVMLARTVTDWRLKGYFIGIALTLTVLIGLTRIYLGVHYPSDVLGGWAAGIAYAILCTMVAAWLQNRGAVEPPESSDKS